MRKVIICGIIITLSLPLGIHNGTAFHLSPGNFPSWSREKAVLYWSERLEGFSFLFSKFIFEKQKNPAKFRFLPQMYPQFMRAALSAFCFFALQSWRTLTLSWSRPFAKAWVVSSIHFEPILTSPRQKIYKMFWANMMLWATTTNSSKRQKQPPPPKI